MYSCAACSWIALRSFAAARAAVPPARYSSRGSRRRMHRRCDFFRSCAQWAPILVCVGFDAHAAQAVPSLYRAVVSDTDGPQAAQVAMRQVLVRLTGERDAAADPALAAERAVQA